MPCGRSSLGAWSGANSDTHAARSLNKSFFFFYHFALAQICDPEITGKKKGGGVDDEAYKNYWSTQTIPDSKMATVDLKNFNADDIIYGAAKLNRRGGVSIPLNIKTNKGTEPILFQAPRMRAPFGVSCFEDTAGPRFTISVSLDGEHEGGSVSDFARFLQEFDAQNVSAAHRNSPAWFKGNHHSKQLLEELYKPMYVPAPASSQYAPTFRGKLRSFKNEIKSLCFNESREPVDICEAVPMDSEVSLFVEVVSLWFMENNFGVTCIVHAFTYE